MLLSTLRVYHTSSPLSLKEALTSESVDDSLYYFGKIKTKMTHKNRYLTTS